MVTGGAVAALVVGDALVGVVVGWLCCAGGVVDPVEDDADDDISDVWVADAAVVVAGVVADVVPEAVSGVVGVVDVLSGGAPGVLVGSTAGTSAADDGGTV